MYLNKPKRITLAALGLALTVPLSAQATCTSTSAEPFRPFFDTFSTDKKFSLERTTWPLKVLRHEVGLEDGRVATGTTQTLVSRKDLAAEPALAIVARERRMELKHGHQKDGATERSGAMVILGKPNTDWVLTYHFTRVGNCWSLDHVEDHSL